MTDWTEAELAALKRAYASGTTRVSYDGKTVEYGSAADLLGRIRTIERERAGTDARPVAGFATWISFAGIADHSTQTDHALRLSSDHPIGAGH